MGKFALLYANTANVGDDIQALAVKRLLPKVDYFVDREQIHSFQEKAKIILNGWWTHSIENWPPQSNLNPLFISMHIDKDFQSNFLSEKSLNYINKQEIGLRDYASFDFLNKNNFKKIYLSFCLTLTFQKYKGIRNNEVLYVDAIGYENNMTHSDENLRNLSVKERLKNAESFLERYKKAKLVITSRLHCALPCIAFGTPVIFIKPTYKPNRIIGYENILNYKQNTANVKKGLLEKCRNFINS